MLKLEKLINKENVRRFGKAAKNSHIQLSQLPPAKHIKENEPPIEDSRPKKQGNVKALKFVKTKFYRSFNPASIKGKQVNQLIDDKNFVKTLNREEAELWEAFTYVVTGFLGKNRSENYLQLILNFKELCQKHQIPMTLKMHTLFHHWDKFPANNSDWSDENGERFHQLIKPCLKTNQGNSLFKTLADYV